MNLFNKKKQDPVKIISNSSDKDNKQLSRNPSLTNVTSNSSKLAFLEQEKNMLKITLEHILKENNQLKSQIEDMKQTVQHNKQQLKEYVDNITNKDKVVEKMNNTIEQLQQRLSMYENFQKNKLNSCTSNETPLFYPKIVNNSMLISNTLATENNEFSNINQTSTKIGNPSDFNYSQNISNNLTPHNMDTSLNGKILYDTNIYKIKKPAYHNKLKTLSLNVSANMNNNTLQSITDQIGTGMKNGFTSTNMLGNQLQKGKLMQQFDRNRILNNISSLNNSLNASFNSVMNNSQTLVTGPNNFLGNIRPNSVSKPVSLKYSQKKVTQNIFTNTSLSNNTSLVRSPKKATVSGGTEVHSLMNNINNVNLSINNVNSEVNNEKLKEVQLNQHKILEEILNMKNDIHFLISNSKISKEKINSKIKNNSMLDDNNDFSIIDIRGNTVYKSQNASFVSNHSNENKKQQVPNNSLNNSPNQSFNQSISRLSKKSLNGKMVRSIYNLKNRTSQQMQLMKFQLILDDYDLNSNILVLIDNNGNCWELVKRPDLSPLMLEKGENVVSVLNKEFENLLFTDKLINIDIKDNYDELQSSAVDLSKFNDSVINNTCNI